MTTEATVHSVSARKMGRHDGWRLGSSRGSFTHTSGAWAGVIPMRTSTGTVDWNAPQGLCMCLGFLTTWQPADSSPGGSGLQSSVPGNKTEGALWCHSVTLLGQALTGSPRLKQGDMEDPHLTEGPHKVKPPMSGTWTTV